MILDKHLNFHGQLQTMYKSTSSRLMLLKRIRNTISPHVATSIYNMMIKPKITYCSTIYLRISQHHKSKIEKIQSRAISIINRGNTKVTLPTLFTTIRRKAVIEVFKCLSHTAPEPFDNYFEITNHNISTEESIIDQTTKDYIWIWKKII